MKLRTVTDKDWYNWHKHFLNEIAEEIDKQKCSIIKCKTDMPENMPISEYFEWDGTSMKSE
jgi:hypothetical protein